MKRAPNQITFEDPNGIQCQGPCKRRLTASSFYKGNMKRCKRCVNVKISLQKYRRGHPKHDAPQTITRATYVVKEINGCKIPVYTRVESAW